MQLDNKSYTAGAAVIALILVAGAVYLAFQSRWIGVAGLAGSALLIWIFSSMADRVPRFFTLLFAIAAALNAGIWVFNLGRQIAFYDELTHGYTSFALSAIVGWLLFARTSVNAAGHEGRFIGYVTAVGLVGGVAWELFEWAIGVIGDAVDTTTDLILDVIGAFLAGLFCVWAAERRRRETAGGHGPAGSIARY